MYTLLSGLALLGAFFLFLVWFYAKKSTLAIIFLIISLYGSYVLLLIGSLWRVP